MTPIIIFGAAVLSGGQPSITLRRRVEAAVRLGATLPTPLYLPTGGLGRHPPAEATVMATLLQELGVPAASILPEATARDTLSSVLACRRLLRQRRHSGPVFAATSAYHLPRCLALLRFAGLQAHACPPPAALGAASHVRRWFWRLREVPALPVDVVLLGVRLLLKRM